MPRSERLRLSDARAVFRVIGELRDRADDRLAWKLHMAAELARLCGTGITGSGEIDRRLPFHEARIKHVVGVNFESQRQEVDYLRRMRSGEYIAGDPALPAIASLHGRSFTRTRHQLVDDDAWRASAHAQEQCRPFDIDSYVTSHASAPRWSLIHVIVLTRPWGERPLSGRERRLIKLFHEELAREWSRPEAGDPRLLDLPPAQARVLKRLCKGEGEKEIAATLNLSRHTVHNYLRRIQERLGTSGRGELAFVAARAMSRVPAPFAAGDE